MSCKCWCVTINNPSESDCELLETLNDPSLCRYAIFGIEGKDRTLHLQGYIQFVDKVRRRYVSSFCPRAFIEKAKGSPKQNRDYCIKEGLFFEWGSYINPGHRSDLDEIKKSIIEGKDELAIASDNFSKWVVYRRSFEAFRSLLIPHRDWVSKIYIFHGKTGTGKSRIVHSLDSNVFVCPDNSGRWFDGYNGQPTVVFDDFTGKDADLGFFLKLCDRYKMSVPVKGGFVNWAPKVICFTSNVNPDEWFSSGNPEMLTAFQRRITMSYYIEDNIVFNDNRAVGNEFNILY